jgi:hypothetical protein
MQSIKLKRMTLFGHVVSIGRGTQMVLAGKPDEKGPTGRTKLRRKDNINPDLEVVIIGRGT